MKAQIVYLGLVLLIGLQVASARQKREEQQSCSLNNKLDYIRLAVQWQPGYCFKTGCRAQSKFSIHGLWPGRMQDKFAPNSCCTRDQFNEAVLAPMRNRLREAWPSLRGSDAGLWRHEYQKHGSCTKDLAGFRSMSQYFQRTLDLFDQLKLNQNNLLGPPTSSNNSISKIELIRALTKHHGGRRIDLDCEWARNTASYLKEIRFCFSQETGNKPIDCPQAMDDCANQIVLMRP